MLYKGSVIFNKDVFLNDISKYVPEVLDYDFDVIQEIFKRVVEVYSRADEKILAYYYLGYILTASDEMLNGGEVQISNITVKGNGEAINSNPYLLKLKRLLDINNINKKTLQKRVVISTF